MSYLRVCARYYLRLSNYFSELLAGKQCLQLSLSQCDGAKIETENVQISAAKIMMKKILTRAVWERLLQL